MEYLYAFTVWYAIGLLSVGLIIPMFVSDDVELIKHMFREHDITSKIIVTAKFVGLILLLSAGGPLTTIALLTLYVKQK